MSNRVKLPVVYVDKDIIVVNKPAMMNSVPAHKNDRNNAVYQVNRFLRQKFPGEMSLVFIVHRLDHDTSGLLLFARHKPAREKLKTMLQNRKIERRYLAWVLGNLEPASGQLKDYLATDEEANEYRQQISDAEHGKLAITHYTTRKAAKDYSLVDIKLETGRTHQIRVQFHHAGHPVMGDRKYAAKGRKNFFAAPSLALLAYQLRFPHPNTGKPMEFKITPPLVFQKMEEAYRS